MHVFEPMAVLEWEPMSPPTEDLEAHEKQLDDTDCERGVLFPTSTLINMHPTTMARYGVWIQELTKGNPRFLIAQPVAFPWLPVPIWGDVIMIKPPVGANWLEAYDFVFAECARRNIPIAFHTTVSALQTGIPGFWSHHIIVHPMSMMQALVTLIADGVFSKYPTLRFAFLEGDSWWVNGLLDRIDEHCAGEWKQLTPPCGPLTREIVTNSCFFTDREIWGSDFPHFDRKVGIMTGIERSNYFFHAKRWLYGTIDA
jgi:hypothetical protein